METFARTQRHAERVRLGYVLGGDEKPHAATADVGSLQMPSPSPLSTVIHTLGPDLKEAGFKRFGVPGR